MGDRRLSDRALTRIEKAINQDPNAEWDSLFDPLVLGPMLCQLEDGAEDAVARDGDRVNSRLHQVKAYPGIYPKMFELYGVSFFEKTGPELWEAIKNADDWGVVERLCIASTVADVDLGFGFITYLERGTNEAWSLVFPKIAEAGEGPQREDFDSWAKRNGFGRRKLTPAEWVEHCQDIRDWYRKERMERRLIYERPSKADAPMAVSQKSSQARQWSSDQMVKDIDEQVRAAPDLNEAGENWVNKDAVAEMDREKRRARFQDPVPDEYKDSE